MMSPLAHAIIRYYQTEAHQSQRFGQYYINRYMVPGTRWPEVFYEESFENALEIIVGTPHTSLIVEN